MFARGVVDDPTGGGETEEAARERQVAAIAVNLLSATESDLTAAATYGDPAEVEAAWTRERKPRPFHRAFSLAVVACVMGCWFILERRKP